MGQQPFLKKDFIKSKNLFNSKFVDKYGLYLPNHASLNKNDIDFISKSFNRIAKPINF